MIDVKKTALDLLDVALIPAGILAGLMLKHHELTRAEMFAYLVFSWGASATAPSFIRDYFPTATDGSMGFLNFGCAIFGGLICLNFYRIVSSKDFWDGLIGRFLR